jgi:intron-binding protein aquarius
MMEANDQGAPAETRPCDNLDRDAALYCQRFVEFIIDIESQLPLRRISHAMMEDINLIVRCQLSDFARHKSAAGQLFNQPVELLLVNSRYEIDTMIGDH